MKTSLLYLLVITFLLIIVAGNLGAQDFKGGVVKYQQTTKHDWDKIFNPKGNAKPNLKNFLAALPRVIKKYRILYFTENTALYAEDPSENAALPRNVQGAMMRASYMKPPTSELKNVHYDFEKNEKTERLEFMTRDFLINEPIANIAWKLTNKKIKIQNYVCQSAELKKGDDTITAFFTSEIPISAGPDAYFGLPGLILAIEVNGETAYMATSVDLTPPQKAKVSKPNTGSKISREEFNKTVEEKVKEFKESGGRRRGRGIR